MERTKKSFTLVEVMIVIAIIGLIAAMGIPKFAAYRENAFAAQRSANAERLVSAVDSYVASRRLKDVSNKAFNGSVNNFLNDAIKGGIAGLEVDGVTMTFPTNLNTSDWVNVWTPYAGAAVYDDDYTGVKND
jgi:type IV pilus assembly protein PilA